MEDCNCEICNLHRDLSISDSYEIARTSLWVLRHHPHPAPLSGWLILDSFRHFEGPIDFSDAEASTWGAAMQSASNLVKSLTGCDRVYSIAFGEAVNHLHMHLVPRFQSDPLTESWAIADYYRSVRSNNLPSLDKRQLRETTLLARQLSAALKLS